MSEQPPEFTEPDVPSEQQPPRPARARRGVTLFVLLIVAALLFAGWQAWPHVRAWLPESGPAEVTAPGTNRLDAIETELEESRNARRQLERRLVDAAAAQRVLREELLAMSERAGLLEASVNQLAAQPRPGADHSAPVSIRLDEIEMLLHIGQQRVELADDRAGAIRAYALARERLARLEEPVYLNLRQSLGQELAALRAMDEDPREHVLGGLDAFEVGLASLPPLHTPGREIPTDARGTGAGRLLSQLVSVRRSDDHIFVAPAQRDLGLTIVRLELAMARAAALQRNSQAFAAALDRIQAWLPRLAPESDALRERRERLHALAGTPLSLPMPVLGTTLQQLRQLRERGPGDGTNDE